jgi:hypothetical protein
MARQKLSIEERSRVVDVYEQDFGRNPKLSFHNVLDGKGQFGLPGPMKLNEAVDAPVEKAGYFVMAFAFRRKKHEELAAWRRGATAPGKPPHVPAERAGIQNEKARRIALADGLGFGQSRREQVNTKVLRARKDLLDSAGKKGM